MIAPGSTDFPLSTGWPRGGFVSWRLRPPGCSTWWSFSVFAAGFSLLVEDDEALLAEDLDERESVA